jgi:hypothetical protein
LGLGRFIGGTLCGGTFWGWDVFCLGRFVWGRFVGAPFFVYLQLPSKASPWSSTQVVTTLRNRLSAVRDIKFELGCPRNKQFFVSVRTETNRNSICFGSVSVFFAKLSCNGHGHGHGHGHFSFVSVCFEWSLDVLVIPKHRNKLFRY